MIRGLYTSGWSMLANTKKMDAISNNLANVNTNAYKKDTVVFETFPEVLTRRINDFRSPLNPTGVVGTMELSSDVGEIFTYFNQGQLVDTKSPLDLAIGNSANAFFTVGVPDENGQLREYYTRDGSFKLNADRQLVTSEGYPVLSEDGPITVTGDDFMVVDDGTIYQNGRATGQLLIRSFEDTAALRKYGNNLLTYTGQADNQPFTGKVVQGFLEQSNVVIVKEMVDMITVMRAYEANQKIIQAQDGTLEKVVNEVGVVR